MTLRSRTFFFLLLTISAITPRAVTAATEGAFTRGPYPQKATTAGVTLVWRTRMAMVPTVRIGTSPRFPQVTIKADHMDTRRTVADGPSSPGLTPLASAPKGTTQYEVNVTGLQPDKKYFYSIYDGTRMLTPDDGSFFFNTLPQPGAAHPCAFWVVGDSGTASESERSVMKAFQKWRTQKRANVDFCVHVGDMAYNKGLDSEFQYGFFDIYSPILRNLSFWPAMGNHEGANSKGSTGLGPYYDAYVCPKNGESGGLPSGTEAYYSWDFGRTHFICLDSHDLPRTADGPMAQWLKADLEKASADWIIAYWHHPPYTRGTHDSDTAKDLIQIRENIMPIIEAGGVDLVLTGHSHIYERSFLLDGAYKTPTLAENVVLNDTSGDPTGTGPYHKRPGNKPNDGTLQIVAGNGGQSLSRKEQPHPLMQRTIVEWGSVIVEVNGNKLTATMINNEGRERDHVQIVKDATVAPKRIANPKKPNPAEGPRKLKGRPSAKDADD